MTPEDPLLKLLERFKQEGVEYVLIGGQAVRLNGYLRATEHVDVLLEATRANGERTKRPSKPTLRFSRMFVKFRSKAYPSAF